MIILHPSKAKKTMEKKITEATWKLLKLHLKEFLNPALEEEIALVEAVVKMKNKVEDLKNDILKLTRFN